MSQCEAIYVASLSDARGERCDRHAETVCADCGSNLCWRCADSCYECGLNFCGKNAGGSTCLEDHAMNYGHQVDLPPKQTCTIAGPSNRHPAIIFGFRGRV